MSKLKSYVDRLTTRLLTNTYIIIGIGVGVSETKKALDESIKRDDSYLDKVANNWGSAAAGSINGILWPITLYSNYRRDKLQWHIIYCG